METNLKAAPGQCLQKNSCSNRHLEGIRITFFISQRECFSVFVQVCIHAWVGFSGTYTDKLFVLEVFAQVLQGRREPRTTWEWALALLLLSLWTFPPQCLSDGCSASLTNSTWGTQTFGGTRRRCLHESGCNGNRVAADSRAQLSVISRLTHGSSTEDMHPTRACVQVVSQWSEVQNKTLKFDASTLARVEFTVRSGLVMLQRCISLHACHLHSVFYFF